MVRASLINIVMFFSALLLPCEPAQAQWAEPDCLSLLTIQDGAKADLFGWHVETLDDIDGDGVPEFACTMPFFGGNNGKVSVRSGRDGSLLWSKTGATGSILGFSLISIADQDGDGLRDVVASAPFDNGGLVRLYSSASGATLQTLLLPGGGTNSFGFSIATDGDYDGDGTIDIVVGSAGFDGVTANGGRVFVYSTSGFALVAVIDPPNGGVNFGSGAAFLGDVNGDGRDDVVIGERLQVNQPPGVALAFSYDGVNSNVLYAIANVDMGSGIEGDRIDAGVDLNLDGVGDVLVGSLGAGKAEVFDGANGGLLFGVFGLPSDTFGSGRMVGDLNQDGHPDLLVGARGDDSIQNNNGKLYIVSGVDGAVIRTMTYSATSSAFGASADVLGDLNGDGWPELVVGASGASNSSGGTLGHVFVMAGAPCVATFTTYGVGHPGALGVPAIQLSAPPQLGEAVDLIVTNSVGTSAPGVLLLGLQPTVAPLPGGATLLVPPQFVSVVQIPSPQLVLALSIPLDATLCGSEVYFQAIQQDMAAAGGASFTQGLAIVLGG